MMHQQSEQQEPAPAEFKLISSSHFILRTWLFRSAIVGTAYLTVALCAWLSDAATSPWIQALPPACGVLLGFLLLHLIDISRRRAGN